MMHISEISKLRNKAKENLNTLVGISQMQYVIGFESAVENVYLECSKLANIDREITQEYQARVLTFCEKLASDINQTSTLSFDMGRLEAYKMCRDVLSKSMVKSV